MSRLALQPGCSDALVDALIARLQDGARHHRVCALDRRGWLLSRMDARSRTIIDGLELVYPTGALVAALMALQGWPGRRQISTEALLSAFLRRLGDREVTVFHFGDRPSRGQRFMEGLCARHPNVRAVGVRSVLDELWGPENNQALFKIGDAKPDVLLVALPSPLRQEWVHAHAQLIDVGLVWGIDRDEGGGRHDR